MAEHISHLCEFWFFSMGNKRKKLDCKSLLTEEPVFVKATAKTVHPYFTHYVKEDESNLRTK